MGVLFAQSCCSNWKSFPDLCISQKRVLGKTEYIKVKLSVFIIFNEIHFLLLICGDWWRPQQQENKLGSTQSRLKCFTRLLAWDSLSSVRLTVNPAYILPLVVLSPFLVTNLRAELLYVIPIPFQCFLYSDFFFLLTIRLALLLITYLYQPFCNAISKWARATNCWLIWIKRPWETCLHFYICHVLSFLKLQRMLRENKPSETWHGILFLPILQIKCALLRCFGITGDQE